MKVTPTPGSVSGRRIDRVGDPLEGLVNLFDLSLVLAVGLLLAALSSAGAVGLLGGGTSGTPVPGEPSGGQNASGQGTAVGTVYRLQDGTYVFQPSGETGTGATAGTGATSGTGTTVTPPTAGTGSATGGTGSFGATSGTDGSPGGGL